MYNNDGDVLATLADESVAWEWAKGRVLANANPHLFERIEECYADNVERVRKEVTRLGKVAQRHGQVAPSVEFSPTRFVREVRFEERVDGELVTRKRKVTMGLMVLYCPEVLGQDDWAVVGVKVLVGGETVTQTIPGENLPDHYLRRDDARCDHCQKARRRNELVIVRHPQLDTVMQVGKQCLHEYTGISPEYALVVAAFYRATGATDPVGVRYEEDLQPWLEWVAMAVRLDGRYWSKAAADSENERRWQESSRAWTYEGSRAQHTTVDHARVLGNVATYDTQSRGRRDESLYPTDEDRSETARVRAFVAGLDPEESQYTRNLTALFRADVLLHRLEGLAASAFAAYHRAQAERQRERERATRPASAWVGPERARVVLDNCEVVGVSTHDGSYGEVYIYRFLHAGKDKITWFSSNDLSLSVGQTVKLQGTVKKCEMYRDEQQTVLTRCKVA